jgi:hypothetical protein
VNFAEIKVGPLSEIISIGRPKGEKILDSRKRNDMLILCTLEWYNFNPLSKLICCCKYKNVSNTRWRIDRANEI